MTKGRYADRARNKRQADLRYAMALKEADQYRARLQQVEALEEQVRLVRQTNERLRKQIKDGTSAEVERLTKRVESLTALLAEQDEYVEQIKRHWPKVLKAFTDMIPPENTKGSPGLNRLEELGRMLGILSEVGVMEPHGVVTKDPEVAKVIRRAKKTKKENAWLRD